MARPLTVLRNRTLKFATAIVLVAVLVSSAVAQPPRPPGGGGGGTTNTAPTCATDGTSANIAFSTSGTNRVITTNFCPNHPVRTINPNDARQNSAFGVTDQRYSVPLAPTLAPTSQTINLTCVPSAVGFARSGAVFFSVFPGTCGGDAVILEGSTFDECGGHAERSGMYHYHLTPSCTLTSAGDTAGQHSPILGYMIDGIPIYGPRGANGAVPTDLDSCGGHSSDGGNNGNYHYHTKPIKGTLPDPATPLTSTSGVGAGWPYTPGCLRGCVPEPYLSTLKGYGSVPQSDYSSCVTAGTAQPQAEAVGSSPAPSGVTSTPALTPPSSTVPPPTSSGSPVPPPSSTRPPGPSPSGPMPPGPSQTGPMPPGPSPSGSVPLGSLGSTTTTNAGSNPPPSPAPSTTAAPAFTIPQVAVGAAPSLPAARLMTSVLCGTVMALLLMVLS